jgi:hypothetical protein
MGDAKAIKDPTVTERLPAISDRGIDLTQIRRMLKLSPPERIRVGVANSNAAFKLFGRARSK